MNVGSLFSGIGLLDFGLHLAGFEHRWLCERDEWRRGILAKRFPEARVHDDIRAFDAGWGRVDLVAGGFPCKGASSAGKREGFGHPETVLWRDMRAAIGELRPRYVLVENVAAILSLHDGAVWGEVVGDLAALGFDAVWDCVPAGAVGAPHLRDRVFAIASHADGERFLAGADGGHDPLGEHQRGDQSSGSPPDSDFARADAHTPPGGPRSGWDGSADGGAASPDASRDAEGGAGPQAGADGERAGAGVDAAADPGGERRQQVARGAHGDEAADARRAEEHDHEPSGAIEAVGRGVRVEWGDYEPAVRRWEAIHGPAPEPLVRGVDDRGAARVVRSRLSALGDGVQVQVGYLAGRHIMSLDAERKAAA